MGRGAPSATRVRVGLGADPDASDSNPAPPSPATVSAAIVGAVETILKLVPLAASVLRPVLLSRLPHKSVPGATQAWYLRSACKLVETSAGAPLRDALLRGVVAHLLELDVEIKWEDIRQPGDESSDDEDVEDDADVDGLDGKDGGAGIFELEDIERTIEEQLVRQAAEWERGTGGTETAEGAQSVASRTRRRGGRDGGRVGLHDGGDGGARGRARRSRRRGGGRRVRRPPLHLRRRAPPRAQVQVYAIFALPRVREGRGEGEERERFFHGGRRFIVAGGGRAHRAPDGSAPSSRGSTRVRGVSRIVPRARRVPLARVSRRDAATIGEVVPRHGESRRERRRRRRRRGGYGRARWIGNARARVRIFVQDRERERRR